MILIISEFSDNSQIRTRRTRHMSNKPVPTHQRTRARGTTPPGADRAPHGRLSEEAAPCEPDPAASNFQYPERLPAPAQRRSAKLSEMKAGARRGAFLALVPFPRPCRRRPCRRRPCRRRPCGLWQRCRLGVQDGDALGVPAWGNDPRGWLDASRS